MSLADALVRFFPILPAIGMGFVWGQARGEKQGYALGYHEGQFDEKARK